VQVEIDSAQRAVAFGLAENDGQLPIQSDAVAQVGSAILIRLDRFFHERTQGSLRILGNFVDADDIAIIGFERVRDFLLERICRHVGENRAPAKEFQRAKWNARSSAGAGTA